MRRDSCTITVCLFLEKRMLMTYSDLERNHPCLDLNQPSARDVSRDAHAPT